MRTKPILDTVIVELTPKQYRKINKAFAAHFKKAPGPSMLAIEPYCKKHPKGGTMKVCLLSVGFSDALSGFIRFARSQSE